MLDQNLFSLCLTFFAAIFAITNPLGAVPIFISLTANLYPKDRNRVNLITSISISVIVITAMLVGSFFLKFFGISINAFRLAGGIMIANIAFPMLSGKIGTQKQNTQEKEELKQSNIESSHDFQASSIAIVPLAMPLMAGPGTISTAILWAEKITSVWILLALTATMVVYSTMVYILFLISPIITRILGSTGINVVTRVVGLFMLALGIQFIVTAFVDIMGNLFHV